MSIGSFFRQLTFAIYYRERNFLLSNAVNEESKVLYVRDPRDRVRRPPRSWRSTATRTPRSSTAG